MQIRKRGAKLPTNFIKIAILLFTADAKKSSTEIREQLKQVHNVKEPRGIRKHLAHLYDKEFLDKTVEIGIGSYYTWKKSFSSFKKIVNFLTENSDVVQQVEIENNKDKEAMDIMLDPPSKFIKPLTAKELSLPFEQRYISEIAYQIDLKDKNTLFDGMRYWFNTNYTISMINQKFVKYFIDKAHKKSVIDFQVSKFYREEMHVKITKKIFKSKCLSSLNEKSLVILMRHSPSLVLYVINLEKTFQNKMIEQDYSDKIFPIVIKDMFSKRFYPHEAENKDYGFKKLVTKDGTFNGLSVFFECNLGIKYD